MWHSLANMSTQIFPLIWFHYSASLIKTETSVLGFQRKSFLKPPCIHSSPWCHIYHRADPNTNELEDAHSVARCKLFTVLFYWKQRHNISFFISLFIYPLRKAVWIPLGQGLWTCSSQTYRMRKISPFYVPLLCIIYLIRGNGCMRVPEADTGVLLKKTMCCIKASLNTTRLRQRHIVIHLF